MSLQRIFVVPTQTPGPGLARVPRGALVLVAPGEAAEALAAGWGAEPEVQVELGPSSAGHDERRYELDALVRRHALGDRWRDVVVVADHDTVDLVVTGLCDLPGAEPGTRSRDGVTVVGLPRSTRSVPLWSVVIGGIVLAAVVAIGADRIYPLLIPAATAVIGVVLLPAPRTRHHGYAALVIAGTGLVGGLLLLSSTARFPME